MDDKKDFFHIGKMTESFRAGDPDLSDDHLYRLWDLRFKLAIAQQLSVISATFSSAFRKENPVNEK